MSRTRRVGRVVLGAVAVGTIAFTGCTSSDDDVVVADDESSAQLDLAGAVERSLESSGRMVVDATAPGVAVSQVMAYSGDDRSYDVTFEEFDDGMDGSIPSPDMHMITVDGVTYSRIDEWGYVESSDEVPEGIEWVSSPSDATVEADASSYFDPSRLGTALRSLDGVAPTGTDEVDGTAVTTFGGSVSYGDLDRAFSDDERFEEAGDSIDQQDPDALRAERLDTMAKEQVLADLTVVVDGQGRLRSLRIDVVDELPGELASCEYLVRQGDDIGVGLVLDIRFEDLGEPVAIDAPDPGTVITEADLHGLEADDGEPDGPTFTTSDGEWTRSELEDWVTDDADMIGVDPVTVPSMSDEELVAAYEQTLAAWAARSSEEADGSSLETSAGAMSRESLESAVVSLGAGFGVDPETVPSMSDEELVAVYEQMMARFEEDTVLRGADEPSDEELFAGCPA